MFPADQEKNGKGENPHPLERIFSVKESLNFCLF